MAEPEKELEPIDEIIDDTLLKNDFIEDDSDLNDNSLSYKQITILIIGGILALFMFVVLLFPIEEIIRFYITKSTQNSGFILDFKKLNFPILGTKSVDSLYMVTKDNIEIKSEEVQFDVDVPELYKGNVITQMEAFSFVLETDDLLLNAKSFKTDVNLILSERENPVLNGGLTISIAGGKIPKIPSFPILGDLSGTNIKSINLNMKKNGNRITFERAVFDLSIAKITLKGRLDLSPIFKASRMDMEICPKLSKEFIIERQDLSDTLSLLAKDGKEACIPLQGTLSDPQINININIPGKEESNVLPDPPKIP